MSTVAPDQLLATAVSELEAAQDLGALEDWHNRYFGRERGEVQALFKQIGSLPADQRKGFGQEINRLKQDLEARYQARFEALDRAALEAKLAAERVDVTLPGRRLAPGTRHPLTQALDATLEVFARMGFEVAEGPEIEEEFFNFTALNTPADHPSRDMQDTFYLPDGRLLRSHTSTVQVRQMLAKEPPLRMVMPGRVYRRDAVTARHYPMFHQIEGLVVGPRVTFGQLKWTLSAMAKGLFGEQTKTRLRPSFFPFTEPSAELDVGCFVCQGAGCRTCSYSGWIELGGCGVVDPNVFRHVCDRRGDDAYDPDRVTGFAFGFGTDRVAMKLSGIPDIRLFWENDLRFLRQF